MKQTQSGTILIRQKKFYNVKIYSEVPQVGLTCKNESDQFTNFKVRYIYILLFDLIKDGKKSQKFFFRKVTSWIT